MQFSRVACLAMILSALLEKVCGNYGYLQSQCRVLSSTKKVELIFSFIFNKIEYIRYNSTDQKIVGYTEFGEKFVENYKNNTFVLVLAEFGIDNCKKIAKALISDGMLNHVTVKPEVIIRSVTEAKGNQKAFLVCSAYDFYPKAIKLTWMRNDKKVTADVTSIEEMADGDWYYQIHSHLEYFPQPGEKISCVVDHASFHKPMIYYWDPSLPETERSKIILGAVGLLMGIFTAAAGVIYYKRKQTDLLIEDAPKLLNRVELRGEWWPHHFSFTEAPAASNIGLLLCNSILI
uniref:major histocompatibility complex class II DCB isoform 1 precursor n=1 Tax=Danio rerio TaxID=7955 RepID=UPI000008AE6F|nr:major histocompatibility complex class II DCB precursor [Danio rerio]CAD32274.3 novel protein similar to MHC class II beta chain [Danio rerio]